MSHVASVSAMTDEQRSDLALTLAGYVDVRPDEPAGSALASCVALLTSGVVDACLVPVSS